MYCSSDDWPALLDLMGHTVSAYVWAYPEEADDATITIYTKQADGTAQTLASTTSCPAKEWTLLKLEDQVLNDDLVDVQVRLGITTNAKYVYFDSSRLMGMNLYRYLMPTDFTHLSRVFVQTQGTADDICDDLGLVPNWEEVFGVTTEEDGTYKYLRLPVLYNKARSIRLMGDTSLETLSADTDTISLSGAKVDLFLANACYQLFKILSGSVSSADTSKYQDEMSRRLFEYEHLKRSHRMYRPMSKPIAWRI